MPATEHTRARLHLHPHAQMNGQPENIMPPAPSGRWVIMGENTDAVC